MFILILKEKFLLPKAENFERSIEDEEQKIEERSENDSEEDDDDCEDDDDKCQKQGNFFAISNMMASLFLKELKIIQKDLYIINNIDTTEITQSIKDFDDIYKIKLGNIFVEMFIELNLFEKKNITHRKRSTKNIQLTKIAEDLLTKLGKISFHYYRKIPMLIPPYNLAHVNGKRIIGSRLR